jgi:hypothetical protein
MLIETSLSGVLRRPIEFALLAAAAPDFGVEIVSAAGRETAEIETAMSRWGQGLGYGVIVPSDPATKSRRGLVVELAARYRLPTIYSLRSAVVDGGLMSYGVDIVELFRQPQFIQIASSRAKSLPSYQCNCRSNLSWWRT